MIQVEKAVFVHGSPVFVDYTPVADLAAGAVVDLGECLGIAHYPIAAGEMGSLSLGEGTYDVLKYPGEAIALWAPVYWDADTETATATSGYSEGVFGKCVRAAAPGDPTVRVYTLPTAT